MMMQCDVRFASGNEAEVELICWVQSPGPSCADDAEECQWRSGEWQWPHAHLLLSFSVHFLLMVQTSCIIIDVCKHPVLLLTCANILYYY